MNRREPFRRSRITARVAVLLSVAATAAMAEDPAVINGVEDWKISLWNCTTEVRAAGGYKDNVLLSPSDGEGSAFFMSGAEILVFRLPTRGWHFHFVGDVMDVRYVDAPQVDSEQSAIAAAQLAKEFGAGWKTTAGLSYLFQNQVFDFSSTYTNQGSIGQILGHTVSPRWGLRKSGDRYWAEGEFLGTRQWLDSPLDSYWQFGPRIAIGRKWERGSELALSWQFSRLKYDSREQVDQAGGVVTNSLLALDSHVVEAAWTQFWDEKRRWQSVTRFGFEASLDNGSGFYDYRNYRLLQQVRYRDEHWEVVARGRISQMEYSTQTVSPSDSSSRRRTLVNLSLRAERRLAKHLKVHASFLWDRSLSNLEFDDYEARTVLGGLALTF